MRFSNLTQTVSLPQSGHQVNLDFAQSNFESYGHMRVEVSLEYRDRAKTFRSVTRNVDDVEVANRQEIETVRMRQLWDVIKREIEGRVIDWMVEVDNAYEVGDL